MLPWARGAHYCHIRDKAHDMAHDAISRAAGRQASRHKAHSHMMMMMVKPATHVCACFTNAAGRIIHLILHVRAKPSPYAPTHICCNSTKLTHMKLGRLKQHLREPAIGSDQQQDQACRKVRVSPPTAPCVSGSARALAVRPGDAQPRDVCRYRQRSGV